MNIDKLKIIYSRYEKNKIYLGFNVVICADPIEEKVFRVTFSNLDNRYKVSLQKLVGELVEEAKKYIASEYLLKFLREEKEFEYLRFDKEMRTEYAILLNCLLTNGLDSFLKNVSFLSIKYKQLYELAHVELKNGRLVDRHGNEIAS